MGVSSEALALGANLFGGIRSGIAGGLALRSAAEGEANAAHVQSRSAAAVSARASSWGGRGFSVNQADIANALRGLRPVRRTGAAAVDDDDGEDEARAWGSLSLR